ncbi:MAG: helix-turn-helix transcriptional regulator [Candidatus Saccharibacteria bacterium]|nr:helix-turn-helix transcriptional regulator [Pseudorhodobacter sp.]
MASGRDDRVSDPVYAGVFERCRHGPGGRARNCPAQHGQSVRNRRNDRFGIRSVVRGVCAGATAAAPSADAAKPDSSSNGPVGPDADLFRGWHLTPTEQDVASFTIKGCSIAEIARLRGSAEGTIKTHLNAIYRKSGVTGRAQLVSVLVEDLLQTPLIGSDIVPHRRAS